MAYDSNKPSNDGFLAEAPQELRNNQEGLRTGQIVDAGTVKGLSPGNAAGQIPISNGAQCAGLNAEKVGGNLPSAFAPAIHNHDMATSLINGFMSNTDKQKIDTVASGAEVNQNAFANVLVGGTTIQADGKSDTLEIVGGPNISVTADAVNDKLTFAVTGKVASATNADTVGGYLPNSFAPSTLGIGGFVSTLTSTDINSVTVGGRYYCNSCTNVPTGASNGFLDVSPLSDILSYQRYTTYYGVSYERINQSGTWSTWRQLATTDQLTTYGIGYTSDRSSADMNDSFGTGFFSGASLVNAPNSCYSYVFNSKRDANNFAQILVDAQNNTAYFRSGYADKKAWRKIATTDSPSFGNLVSINGTYPYLQLTPSTWSGQSAFIQSGVDYVGGTSNSACTAFINPAGKGFSFCIGNSSKMYITPDGETNCSGSISSTGTGWNQATSPSIFLINSTSGTGKTVVLNSLDSGGFQVADYNSGVSWFWVKPDLTGYLGSKQIATTDKLDPGHSFGTNGWQKLPSGLILQWGYCSSGQAITFPIAFPNACNGVYSAITGYPGMSIIADEQHGDTYQVSTTGFTAIWQSYWLALGY